ISLCGRLFGVCLPSRRFLSFSFVATSSRPKKSARPVGRAARRFVRSRFRLANTQGLIRQSLAFYFSFRVSPLLGVAHHLSIDNRHPQRAPYQEAVPECPVRERYD